MSYLQKRIGKQIATSVKQALLFVSLFGLAATASAGVTGGFSVNINSREEVRSFYNGVFTSSDGVPINSSAVVASCIPGTNSTAFQEAVLRRINWIRALAGMPANVTFDVNYSSNAQKAALIMAANDALNHTPPSTWACWTAAGSNAASHANLAWFANGAQAVINYINESGNAGHRRWILYPNSQVMGTGDMPAQGSHQEANALWVFGDIGFPPRPATRNSFVSWPPPGYTPYQVAFGGWSFAYTNADFTSAKVTMRSNNVPISSVLLQPVANNYGENTLVWEPTNFFTGRPTADIVYSVGVSNVVINGVTNNFNYTVTVFDPATPGPDTRVPTISGPAQPTVGQNNAYTFTAVSNATSYQWRRIPRVPFSLTDGLENGLGNFAVGMSTNLYPPIVTDIVASGTHALHFLHPEFKDQTLTFTNLFYAATNSMLTFNSRLARATTTEFAKIQASVDDGATWTDLYSQTGTSGSGEASFTTRSVPLGSLAGSSVRLRFNYTFEIFIYNQTNSGFGWYVDDIVLTNIEQQLTPVITSTATTNFTFNPSQAGNYSLDVRALIYSEFPLEWGPTKLVSAIGGGNQPVATTFAATSVTTNAATLNGSGLPSGNATGGYFQWGTNTSYGTTSAPVSLGSGVSAVAFSNAISGLVPGRTYHYRAVASNSVAVVYGSDMTFTTASLPVAPTVTTLAVTGVTTNAATLNGSVNPNGSASIGFFQWGTNTNYGTTSAPVSLGSGSSAVPLSTSLSGLVPGRTYHYRAVGSNVVGLVYGSSLTFTAGTPPPAPTVTTLAASGITTNVATLNGSANPNGSPATGFFQWGTNASYGQNTPPVSLGSGSSAVPLSTPLNGLLPGQTYHFRAAASNVVGLVYGGDMSFTTMRVPIVGPLTITRSGTNVIVSWPDGFSGVLQERLTLAPATWRNSSSDTIHSVTRPVTNAAAFYQLAYLPAGRWAASVLGYSSAYGANPADGWSAAQALGQPNAYPDYGDLGTAWASASGDNPTEFLELGFNTPAPISSVSIYETYNPGAVSKISVRNPSATWVEVWSGTASPASPASRIFTVTFPRTSFPVDAVRIDLASAAVPDFNEIDAVSISSNDDFANRLPLSGAPLTELASSVGATKESGEPIHAANPGGHSLWWSWTAPNNGPATISTFGSSFDTLLAVYTGAALNGLTQIAANDDAPGGATFSSLLTFTAVQNVTYQIAVDGYFDGASAASGDVKLTVTMP